MLRKSFCFIRGLREDLLLYKNVGELITKVKSPMRKISKCFRNRVYQELKTNNCLHTQIRKKTVVSNMKRVLTETTKPAEVIFTDNICNIMTFCHMNNYDSLSFCLCKVTIKKFNTHAKFS